MSLPVFLTYYLGLPLNERPLFVLPLRFLRRAMMHSPHPFGKGRGGCGGVLASEAVVARFWSPHPSKEGRGSRPGSWVRLGSNWGSEGEGVVVEE
jgi:hypothetical protein